MEIYYKSRDIELSKNKLEDSKDKFEYKRNGETLQKFLEMSNSMNENFFDENDFKRLIKTFVSSFINKSFDNIIVLAGAGASVVTEKGMINRSYGKTIRMIAELVEQKLSENGNKYYSLEQLATMSKFENELYENNKELLNDFNLEDFLSNLMQYEKYVENGKKDKFLRSKNKILDTIKEGVRYEYNSEIMKHGKLIKILSDKIKSPNKLSVVTTNYDILFEEAANELNFTVIDGFSFTYKPKFDIDIFEWNLVKNIPNIRTKEVEYKKNIINLLKIHGSLTWEIEDEDIYRGLQNEIDNPVMVFPSSKKYYQSYQKPYFELFSKFQELLKQNNTLLITTGFSFCDNHIAKMITQAILNNSSLSILITDFNISQDHINWKELEKLMTQGYRISFLKATLNGDLTDYLGDENIDNR